VKVQNENTAPPSGQPQYIGWCLDKEDLCVAKLCAFREKDRNFVDALIANGLVDGGDRRPRRDRPRALCLKHRACNFMARAPDRVRSMTVTPSPATMSTETDQMTMVMPERKDDRSCVV
jgi:hypothetical protein